MEQVSKSYFKTHALRVLRDIEQSGEPRIITDRGKPTLEVRKLRQQNKNPLDVLSGTVVKFVDPTDPVSDSDWEGA